MSTSLLYHGFGVREVIYQRTEYKGNQIIFWVESPRDRMKCAECCSKNVNLRGSKIRRFHSVPIGKKRLKLHTQYHVSNAINVKVFAK